ncbi:MAG: MATE family efflux transporter [Clostridia bacterium]|nr:MATE family efflux transporter [Clostridia bacterium]
MLTLKSLIGDRAFYKRVLAVMMPILAQNLITNLISSLDNMMTGPLGTAEMSGVSVVNQLLFVFNWCLFGMVSGAGIFAAQAYGRRDREGVRDVFRFTWYVGAVILAVGLFVFSLFGDSLISLYLHEGEGSDPAVILSFAREYLGIMILALIPYTVAQVYGGTLRATGNTVPPMLAALFGVLTNLALNWVLIFGHLGAPALGVRGAALATVISRVVECAAVVIYTHCHKARCEFIRGAYASPRIPKALARSILIKGMPLMMNEGLYAMGLATLLASYAVRGGDTLASLNIAGTICDLFTYLFISAGSATAILLGHILGTGDTAAARDASRKLIAFTLGMGIICGILLAVGSPFFPLLYEATDTVRLLASRFILIRAAASPLLGYLNGCYFTILSGGSTVVIFFLDSVFIWSVNVLLAFLLSSFTAIPILAVYAICTFADVLKAMIGTVLVRRGRWAMQLSEA